MRKRNYFLTTATAFIALVCHATYGAGLKDPGTVFQSGNWKVARSVDPMRDTVKCTGTHKKNLGILLTENILFVSVAGGLRSVTLRFGDKPALPLRTPGTIEKQVSSIIIGGAEFSELLESDRLRVEALTMISGLFYEDISLTGIKDAVENIKGGCPAQATPEATPKSK